MHTAVGIAGALLIWVILWDAFATIVMPRTVSFFRPSTYFYHGSWRLWTALAALVRDIQRRQNFYAIFGPLSVPLLLAFWALGLVFGFAMMHWGFDTRIFSEETGRWGFGTMLYLSGTTFFTLGLGDFTAVNSLGRLFIVLEAATGFVSLAIIVGYVPLLDQVFSQREAQITLFGLRTGTPQCAVRLLEGYGKAEERGKLEAILHDSEQWIAEFLQNHISHPVLAYYRSQHFGQSWLTALTAFLDTCALLQLPVGHPLRSQVKTSFRMSLYALVEMARVLKVRRDRTAQDRLGSEDFEKIRGALEKVGLFFPAGPEAEKSLTELRRLYEPFALAVSERLKIPLPVWVPSAASEGP